MQPLKHFPNMPSKYKHMCKHNHNMAIESITVDAGCRCVVYPKYKHKYKREIEKHDLTVVLHC